MFRVGAKTEVGLRNLKHTYIFVSALCYFHHIGHLSQTALNRHLNGLYVLYMISLLKVFLAESKDKVYKLLNIHDIFSNM